jgi:LysR family transcriptional activator of nhaA
VEWLNYHHLLYFWLVAREGSVVRAAKELRLAQQTVSGQIRHLEGVLGQKLFVRRGRGLVLTEAGQTAFRYADAIFSLGQEFLETMSGRAGGAPMRLVVGIAGGLAKSVVHRILEPAFRLDTPVQVICRENRSREAFMGELASHSVDILLTDAPAGPGTPIRAFSHLLGECGTTFFSSPAIVRSAGKRFPQSLDGAPFLMPSTDSTSRRALDEWFYARNIRPRVVAELDDAALVHELGAAGVGAFAAPDVIEKEVRRRYAVRPIGRTDDVRHRYYVISLERKIRHHAVIAICDVARKHIFV